MTEIIQGGLYYAQPEHSRCDTAKITEAIGNAALHELNAEHVTQQTVAHSAMQGLNAEHVTQQTVADSTMHGLNSAHITQKEVADATRDILIDQAAVKQQLGGVVDTIHQDGNFTRTDVKSEGRNLDNKVCDVEHHIADVRYETANGFRRTDTLIQENKFELTKQNLENRFEFSKQTSELHRNIDSKYERLQTENLKQHSKTRELILETERRELERRVQSLELRDACRTSQGDTVNIVNSNIANSLGAITQALTHLSSSLKL